MMDASIEIKVKASDALGVGIGNLSHFSQTDPFNPVNCVDGYISMKQNASYGSIYINSVNDEICEQVIFTMPKIEYPFIFRDNGDRIYNWPKVNELRYYTKYDGSNIVGYRYCDNYGNTFISYKMRTQPFMKKSRWGNWPVLWGKMLNKYPQIPRLISQSIVDNQHCSVAFELFGNENPHMVQYKVGLDTVVLLFRSWDGSKIIPADLMDTMGIPCAALVDILNNNNSNLATEKYNKWREILHKKNISIGDDVIIDEGLIVYLGDKKSGYQLRKLKPSEVEEIAFKQGLNSKHIISAIMKVIEADSNLTIETVKAELAVDFAENDIEEFTSVIELLIREKITELEFSASVVEKYNEFIESGNPTLSEDKGTVMRHMSTLFPRNEMTKVYTAIARRERLI